MARSRVGDLVARGIAVDSIRVAEPVDALRESLQRDFGVATAADNAEVVDGAATWVLAVKPQVLREVCEALSGQARAQRPRSEEHTSELQSLMRISYAVFCLKQNIQTR